MGKGELMQNPPTEIAQWLDSIYEERDRALARNRDLQQWLDVAREMINSQAKENARLTQRLRELEGK